MGVGLLPLEFTDCLTDSPHFRDNLHAHEKELEKTSHQIKRLIKEVKELLTAARNLSRAQRTLSNSLQNFNFECIGTSQTDDEVVISNSLANFGRLIASIEDERDTMLELAYERIILPLENFRKEHIGGVKEGKKKFDKHTSKFCQSQERYLNLSTKKQDVVLQEADATLQMEQRHFQQASLEYVCLLQQVQERKKFEFVETLLGFMFGWLTFYHQGHEVGEDFKPYMRELQLRIQKTRENFDATRVKTELLMKKMLEMRSVNPVVSPSPQKVYTREGYLFLMEKKAFGTTWTKLYCMYQKDTKEFTMIPFNQLTGKTNSSEKMILASCVRRMSDSIEKRFCFDLTSVDKPGVVYTLQALSEEDRKLWMDVMDGKEPTYTQPGKSSRPEERALDDVGFAFVAKCIDTLEKRGLEEQGLYRVVGITSKVTKLLSLGLDRRRLERLSLDDVLEWESKTITSALKTYLRNLPEPLTTFRFHNSFIAAAKQETRAMRVNEVHILMHRIPKANFNMLDMLIQHLINVAAKADKNLMSISNLGVCFGPTLLRPEVETVAAIMDIKFCNVVVEILIENYHTIFKSEPENLDAHSFEPPQHPQLLGNTGAAAGPHPLQAISKSLQHDLNVSTHSVVEGGPSSSSHAVGGGSVSQRYLKNISESHGAMQPAPPSSVQQRLVSRHHGPGSRAPAYSEGNLLTLQQQSMIMAQAQPQAPASSHALHKANPMTYASSCADYLNSTSSSNESVSSLSSRDANSIGNYVMLTPQKNKRAVGAQIDGRYTSSYQPSDTLRVRTLYACLGENDGELSFEPNQIITNVRSSLEPGWLVGTLNGKSGLVPENYVEVLP